MDVERSAAPKPSHLWHCYLRRPSLDIVWRRGQSLLLVESASGERKRQRGRRRRYNRHTVQDTGLSLPTLVGELLQRADARGRLLLGRRPIIIGDDDATLPAALKPSAEGRVGKGTGKLEQVERWPLQ